jgi:oligopeptide transport system substrate-binding protein
VLKSAQVPALGLVPVGGIPGYEPPQPDWAKLPLGARIEAARALMIEARGSDAPPLKLTLRLTKSEQAGLLCAAIAQMWKAALGVEVSLDTTEWSVLEQDINTKNFQLAVFGWSADYADPWTFLSIFRSDSGQINASGYRNPAYDALLDESRRQPDRERRFAVLEQAEAMIMADEPIIPLNFNVTQALVSPHVAGFAPSPLNLNPSRYLSWKE